MSENSINRITVYKLLVKDFSEVDLKQYELVISDEYHSEEISLPYKLYFLKQFSKRASWYNVFSGLDLTITDYAIPKTLVAGFILIVNVNDSFYAVTGGVGHLHLKSQLRIEHRF